ncbi:MAG: hypothetical protein R2873_11730 [Caldilineaceae bacterium]
MKGLLRLFALLILVVAVTACVQVAPAPAPGDSGSAGGDAAAPADDLLAEIMGAAPSASPPIPTTSRSRSSIPMANSSALMWTWPRKLPAAWVWKSNSSPPTGI